MENGSVENSNEPRRVWYLNAIRFRSIVDAKHWRTAWQKNNDSYPPPSSLGHLMPPGIRGQTREEGPRKRRFPDPERSITEVNGKRT